MPGLATALDTAPTLRSDAQAACSPLRAMADTMVQIGRQLQAGLAAADSAALRAGAQRLQGQLFLSASQLLPLWRDLGHDHAVVDQAEVRLDQLRHLVDMVLQHGADDTLLLARSAVLVQELQQHQRRQQALLRALCAVLAPADLQALAALWQAESRRLQQGWQRGAAPAMDNEDADPVGQPAR
jgi:hypothetical protein